MYRKIGRNEKIRGKLRKKGEKRAIKVKISNKYAEFLVEESVFKGEKVGGNYIEQPCNIQIMIMLKNKHHRNHEHCQNQLALEPKSKNSDAYKIKISVTGSK